MEIQAVIFDLGRVLVDVVIDDEFKTALGWAPADGKGERARAVFDTLYRDFSTGRIGPQEFHSALVNELGLELEFERFVELWCSIVAPMPGAEGLFEAVAGKLRVGLLSDTDPLHWQYVKQRFPFVGRIPRPTLSFRTGWLKPQPEAYIAACRNVDLPPERCLFIDDKPENVEGAMKAGLDAMLFEGTE
ncbi:MAG: hypothetical protein D6806_12495, partial [Deltaproteobacteria bacterium]